MIQIRQAVEADVDQIREIFLACYGTDYAYPQFYDTQLLKKMVYSDHTLLLVAEDPQTGRVLGTASVLVETGAYADLVGEFGRLAVHPDARNRGIGKQLMQGRLQAVQNRLHLGIVEPRLVHAYSQRIALKHGFVPLGFQLLKWRLSQRESVALVGQYFGEALRLRRNHPHVIPEAYPLAAHVLPACGIKCDVIVDEESAPYPHYDGFQLDELTTEGYSTLLRFQRGRIRRREIFGPMRLHYGLFKLRARKSDYLIAREHGRIVGAVGYTVDTLERVARIFELICLEDRPIRFLLAELERKCRQELGVEYIEVDVNADAARAQRTLLELNFLPTAYIPAMVFHEVERLDAIRMVRLTVPVDLKGLDLVAEIEAVAEIVQQQFLEHDVSPRILEAIPKIAIFSGLNEEQSRRLAGQSLIKWFEPGEKLLVEREAGGSNYLVLQGEVDISLGCPPQSVGKIRPGEMLGEMSLLLAGHHTATATALTRVETAVLSQPRLRELVRLRPDIGVILYRNLAIGLGEKLKRSAAQLAQAGTEEPPAGQWAEEI